MPPVGTHILRIQVCGNLLGHDISQIVITADSVRHMKKHHGDAIAEANRGQIAMTAEDALLIPYILNNFDSVERSPGNDRPHGERSVEIRKQINGVAIVATIEQGKDKQFVVTGWKKVSAASMQSGTPASPRPNVLNDTYKKRIAQEIAKIKQKARNVSAPTSCGFKCVETGRIRRASTASTALTWPMTPRSCFPKNAASGVAWKRIASRPKSSRHSAGQSSHSRTTRLPCAPTDP